MRKKYLLGIDLGTDSCGFCLCDENSHIVKKNGKYLWGARLFDEANDCKDRRTARNSRRRIARRNKRIQFLQELMACEIAKVDDKFFKRLEFAQLQKEDKNKINFDYHYTLFNDPNYSDKEYYKKYPTIYHLKAELLNKPEIKFDIREIYLALAHYMKHRGHFLEENLKIEDGKLNFNEIVSSSLKLLIDRLNLKIDANEATNKLINNVKENKKLKADFLKKEVLISNDGDLQTIIDKVYVLLLTRDNGVTYKDMFKYLLKDNNEYEDEEDEEILKDKLSFNSETFEDDLNKFVSLLAKYDDNLDIKEIIQALYNLDNNLKLIKLLGDSKTISEAFVKKYEDHEKQLKEFKNYIKQNHKELYKDMFYYDESNNDKDSSDKDKKIKYNYAYYVGSNLKSNKKLRYSKCTQDQFYSFVKKELNLDKIDESDEYLQKLKELIENKEFLVKQRTNANGLFPYQLNEYEIKTILKNQSQYYPFLNESDEYGSVLDKIVKIFSYKIPYYYGPISRFNSSDKNKSINNFSWAIYNNDKKDLKVRPWNIQDIVNEKETGQKFIQRLQNKCSYLHDKFCLPKQSPLIQLFNVLNELNKIAINGELLHNDEKLKLLKELYLVKSKVTEKDIKNYYKERTNIPVDQISVNFINNPTGKFFQLNSNLSSFIQLSKILNLTDKDLYLSSGYIERIEKIEKIVWAIAIYEDKKLLENYLRENKDNFNLNDEQIKQLKGISSKGFSRLSKELLVDLKPIDDEYGLSIIDEMISTNKNFMEIVEKENSGYKLAIDRHNKEYLDENYSNMNNEDVVEYVKNMYVSPGMKRPLIQAYKIIEELKEIVSNRDGKIEEYYIECTRTNKAEKNKKSESRKERLSAIYEDAKKMTAELNIKCDNIKGKFEKVTDDKFNSDKIYLYFTQLGKDIYTLEPIDFDRLDTDYDIDHIYPQSLFKDDSLNNRVLVKKSVNNKKSDTYPIIYKNFQSKYSIDEIKRYQEMLCHMDLIKKEKLNRLTRQNELTEDEINNFVSRQIVYTSQSVKALKELIETFEPDSKVIMSKAENISDFRRDYDIIKARDANNLHHGHDAFLNIIVGRAINEYYTNKWYLHVNKDGKKYTKNVNNIFKNYKDTDKDDFFDKDGNLIWRYSNDETLNYIRKQVYENHNMLITTRTYKKNTLFEKVTIKSAKELKGSALPTKRELEYSDNRYGGYSDLSFNFYTLIKVITKKGEEYKLVSYPGIYKITESQSEKIKKYNLEMQRKYIQSNYNVSEYEIVKGCEQLNINTVFEIGKSRFCITGKTGTSFVIKNLKEAFYNKNSIETIKKISKLNDFLTKKGYFNEKTQKAFLDRYNYLFKDENTFIISPARNNECKEITITKQELYDLYEEVINKLSMGMYLELSNLVSTNNKLISSRDKIYELNILELVELLNEVVKLTQTNRELSDLSLICEKSKNSGTLKLSSTLPKGIKIIYQSVTGYYSKVVWENK